MKQMNLLAVCAIMIAACCAGTQMLASSPRSANASVSPVENPDRSLIEAIHDFISLRRR